MKQTILIKRIALAFSLALLVSMTLLTCEASAQVSDLTFSRPGTGDVSVSEIEFSFNVAADVEVQIDQLGAVAALFQNNDTFGQDFGIVAAGPVDSIGEVTIGQVLSSGTDFGSTSLVVSDFIAPGEDFYLGFSSGADVGYFNIAWDAGANSSIFYSKGEFATGGFPLIVAAVPEPSSLILISALTFVGVVRRRR